MTNRMLLAMGGVALAASLAACTSSSTPAPSDTASGATTPGSTVPGTTNPDGTASGDQAGQESGGDGSTVATVAPASRASITAAPATPSVQTPADYKKQIRVAKAPATLLKRYAGSAVSIIGKGWHGTLPAGASNTQIIEYVVTKKSSQPVVTVRPAYNGEGNAIGPVQLSYGYAYFFSLRVTPVGGRNGIRISSLSGDTITEYKGV